jgi:hypothetical protein
MAAPLNGTSSVRLMPLVAVTIMNYAAQVPYSIHNGDFSAQRPLDVVRGTVLLGVTLAWFVLGLTAYVHKLRWGLAVLVSFLVTEALFYAATFVTGMFIFQLGNPSYLLKAVFITGYASGAVAAFYAFRLTRDHARSRRLGSQTASVL